jgi:hypothetical protein
MFEQRVFEMERVGRVVQEMDTDLLIAKRLGDGVAGVWR